MSTRSGKQKTNELAPSLLEDAKTAEQNIEFKALLIEQRKEFKQLLCDQQLMFKKLIKESEERVLQRLGDVVADLANMRSNVRKLSGDVVNVNKRCDSLERELNKMRASFSVLQNEAVATDVVINNVPNDVDAESSFIKLMDTLPCGRLKFNSVFRTRSLINNNIKNNAIIAKLNSPADRVKLFKALAEYRKINNRQPTLSDIGLSGAEHVVVHECLSKHNKEVLNAALRLKRDKLLTATFSLRGTIYIRARPDDRAIKVIDVDEVNAIVGNLNTKSSANNS